MAKIEVQLSGGGHSGLVWSKESVLRLRRDHRILGSLVGADARFPREMTGLPLLLSEQEMHVLIEEAVIRLVYLPRLVLPLSQEVKEKAEKYDEDSYQKQIQLLKNERELSIRSFADRIVEGKRKKMLQKIKRQKTEEKSSEEPIIEIDKEKVIAEEVAKIQPIKKEHQVIQIFTQDPWIDDCDKLEARLSHPTTDVDKCRLFAFKILWKKGYYITEGSKFGGDYLVYLGDPVKFHASYIVLCLDKNSHNSLFSRPQDLVAKSRLGGQVHKTVLIAKLNVTKDGVSFTSIRRNFSKRQVQYFLSTDDGEANSQEYSDDNMQTFDADEPKLVDNADEDPKLLDSAGDDHQKVDNANDDAKLVDNENDEVEEGFEDEI